MNLNFNNFKATHNLTLSSLILVAFLSFSKFSISQNRLKLKKSIAVSGFEDASQYTNGQTNQNNDPNSQTTTNNSDHSNTLVIMLAHELNKTNLFVVTDGPPPAEGVQMIVTGTIVKWETNQNPDPKNDRHIQYTSTVTVALRVVDETGQIITAQTASKTVKQNNTLFEKQDNTLDDALRDVVTQCIGYIKATAIKVEWQGSIVKAEPDGTIFIEPGSIGGVATGMVFGVYEKGEELKDANGQSLGFDLKKVGSIKVTSDFGNGKAAKAIKVSGNGIKSGDIIKPE